MELDRRLKLRNHQMPQFEQEEEEWEMSPVRRVQDSFVSAVYREPASAILTDASN